MMQSAEHGGFRHSKTVGHIVSTWACRDRCIAFNLGSMKRSRSERRSSLFAGRLVRACLPMKLFANNGILALVLRNNSVRAERRSAVTRY
jgi:hypothetical protein